MWVSPETRNSSGSVYQGPMATRPAGREALENGLGLGPHLEVVVDDGHLPVEQEAGVGQVVLERWQELVEQVDEPESKRLERRVPLAIPVRVGDDGDGERFPFGHARRYPPRFGHRQSAIAL